MQNSSAAVDQRNGDKAISETETVALQSASLQQLCATIHTRVNAFVEEETGVDLLRKVQQQTRTSLRVMEEALTKYS